MQAIWNNTVLAESNETIVVENNHYFPRSTLISEFFVSSNTTSHCPWKGDANYYSINVNGEENKDAAWFYKPPKKEAIKILNHVAFWHGVVVIE